MKKITKAVRVEPGPDGRVVLGDGEYGRDENSGIWYARPPGNHMGSLENHQVTEHEDGTITVAPSILIDDGRAKWHGYLTKGEWRELGR